MLLPAKFQTPTPAALGAKVVAIVPAPKPHVHQWVSVPDSKMHSRCAECGTVTLTEIVAPKVSSGLSILLDAQRKLEQRVFGVDPAAPGSDRTVFSERFLGKPYSFVDLLHTPKQVPLSPPDNKTAVEMLTKYAASKRRLMTWAEIGEAFCKPAHHYTSITAPDGKVRMVETDAEGWIKNDGTQPVADDVRVEVQTDVGNCMTFNARTFVWECISRWRPAA